MAEIDRILQHADAKGATDVHLRSDLRPRLRVNGELLEVEGFPELSAVDIDRLTMEVMTEDQSKHFATHDDLNFTYSGPYGRFRCACFRDYRGPGAVFRYVPQRVPRLGELNLPEDVEQFAHLRRGLMLITGPAQSGKSSTVAAILATINETYHKHVITLEDPIEFVFEDDLGVFHQRNLHDDFDSLATGIADAMCQDPDVLVVGGLSDPATIRQALLAAESGVLVIATLDTNGAAETIDKIIGSFPVPEQSQVRVQLAGCLAGIVSQALLRLSDGSGRVPATEVLVGTPAVSAVIREERTHDVTNIIQGGRSHGMHTLDDSLKELLDRNKVTPNEAWSHARNKGRFERSRYSALRT